MRAWAVLTAATLSGCVRLSPDFQSPRQAWIDHWDSQALDAASQQHPQPDQRQWWAQFEDPLLERLIAEAGLEQSSAERQGRPDAGPGDSPDLR